MLTKNDYQSTVNLQAIINSFARLMPRIAEECQGTSAINTHPICRMYAEQIAYLSGTKYTYCEAYDICEERSK